MKEVAANERGWTHCVQRPNIRVHLRSFAACSRYVFIADEHRSCAPRHESMADDELLQQHRSARAAERNCLDDGIANPRLEGAAVFAFHFVDVLPKLFPSSFRPAALP